MFISQSNSVFGRDRTDSYFYSTMDLTCDEEMLPEEESPLARPAPRSLPQGQLLPANFQLGPPSSPLEILNNPQILEYMLQNDNYNRPDPEYFSSLQTDITKEMRATVASWMQDVCDEEGFTESVFARATNIMDRFLSVHKLERSHFQLLGATCLLLSSKWSGSIMSCDRLVFFTAHSITLEMLQEWEFMVMFQINWDVYSLTPNEFIEPLFHKLPQNLWDPVKFKKDIMAFTGFCCTDYSYSIYAPSIIVAASFAAALQKSQLSQEVIADVLSQLQILTKVQVDLMKSLSKEIVMKFRAAKLENYPVPGQHPGTIWEPRLNLMYEDETLSDKMAELGELEQAETPTDVRDIEF